MRVASAVSVDNDLLARCQRLLAQLGLVGPRAVEVAHPYVAATDGQHGRGKSGQCHCLLLVVRDFRPCLNHVFLNVRFVVQCHCDRVGGVFQCDACHEVAFVHHLALLKVFCYQGCRHIAVRMGHGQCGFSGCVQTMGRVGLHASEDGRLLQVLKFLGVQLLTIIHILGLLPLLYIQYQCGVLGFHNHLLCLHRDRCQTKHCCSE